MPTKRRCSKRRLDPVAELEPWVELFSIGMATTGDLMALGMTTEAEMLERAPEVWSRLGRTFLDREMAPAGDGTPWAVEQFGEPPCR